MQDALHALVAEAAQGADAPPLARLPEVQAIITTARKAAVDPALLGRGEAVLQAMEARAQAAKPATTTVRQPPAYRPPVARVWVVRTSLHV